MMPSLAATQHLLRQLIAAPEGVAAALAADAGAGGDLCAMLERTVAASARLDAVARLEIYANMYFYRLLDVLKDDYPATLAVVGETGFYNLITDYLLRHPPSHFSVRYAGRWLPEFLQEHRLRDDAPAAADLAAFERALGDAVDAADAPQLDPAYLQRVPPEQWADLRLRLHPSVRLLQSEWAVQRLRQRVDRGEPPGEAEAERTFLCCWRRDREVLHRGLPEVEWRALRALEQGMRFGAVCAAAAEVCAAADAAVAVAGALGGWVSDGLLAGFEQGGTR